MLGGVDSEPGPAPGRRREIDTRLDAVRARLKKLRERDWDAVKSRAAAPGERLKRPGATRPRRTLLPRKCWPPARRRSAGRPRRTNASPACTRGQQRQGSATCACASGRQYSTGPLPPPTGSEPNVPSHFSPNPGGPGLPLSSMSHPTARPHNGTGPHWKPGNRCLTRHDQDLEAASSRVAARRARRAGPRPQPASRRRPFPSRPSCPSERGVAGRRLT